MSVLLPSLRRAKEFAQRVSCFGHLKQLSVAWLMYSNENNGQLVPCRAVEDYPEQAWTGWNYFDYSYEEQVAAIRGDRFFDYAGSVDLYRCAVSKGDDGLRTYCWSCVWNPLSRSGTSDGNHWAISNMYADSRS